MTFWQIIACIAIGLIFVLGITGILMLRKALKRENDLNRQRFIREQEWHDKEEENWRYVDPALRKRIKELERTCKESQETIWALKLELANKDDFMRDFKVKDLYDKLYLMK